ncbi:MAG: type IV pilus assembly protein PilM [Akkermansiaceae bacterium]|nr:type IV pilus assembly protein PilM [Akkermansiaceae bacterium]
MAAANTIVTLNIGSQRIAMAAFDVSKSGLLTLLKYDSTSILADPAAEMARLPQIRVAISELIDRLGISKTTKVRYSISGQSVFTRFIKLPPIEDDNIEQLVAFEAQQHVPFPIEEVIWDWQLLDSNSSEKEVALVAIKGDSLNDLNDIVADTGLKTIDVDASPMSLYNALLFNYPELEGTSLLIDIGAKTCNLIYLEGKRMFTRSVAVGGASITTAIAKEYGINFSEAEAQKCNNGLVALNTAHTSELSDDSAALAMVIRNALSKLPAEIARTTNYFRSQHGGRAPQKIFLSGGGANLPYIDKFFEDKLNLPVERFNPLRGLSVGAEVNIEQLNAEAHMLGELVGLALRAEGRTPLTIDLVPEQVFHERETKRRKPWLVAASMLLIAGWAVWSWTNMGRKGLSEEGLKIITQQVSERDRYARPLDKLAKQEAQLEVDALQLSGEQAARTDWIDLLDDLALHFKSDKVWIVDFDPVVGFVRSDIDPESSGEETANILQSVIKSDYAAIKSGESAMAQINMDALSNGDKPQRAQVGKTPKSPEITAIRVKGFWREKNGHKEVDELIDRLRNGSKYFNVMPTQQTIIEKPTDLGDAYAARFEIILPLRKPLSMKYSSAISK